MNINDNEITFIICNRGGDKLFYCIDKINDLYPYSKYIVVNQDDDLPFMRGQLFNIGVKFSTTKYICLIDNDIFFNESATFLKSIKSYKAFLLKNQPNKKYFML